MAIDKLIRFWKLHAFLLAALFGAGYALGYWGGREPPAIPRYMELIKLGNSMADLERLGAARMLDETIVAPGEIDLPAEDSISGFRSIGGNTIRAKIRFRDGRLSYFELVPGSWPPGTPVKLEHLRSDCVELGEASVYSKSELFNAMGEGILVAYTLDDTGNSSEVYRWAVQSPVQQPWYLKWRWWRGRVTMGSVQARIAGNRVLECAINGVNERDQPA